MIEKGRSKVEVSNLLLPLLCYTMGQLADRLKLRVFVGRVQNGTIKPSGSLQNTETNSSTVCSKFVKVRCLMGDIYEVILRLELQNASESKTLYSKKVLSSFTGAF